VQSNQATAFPSIHSYIYVGSAQRLGWLYPANTLPIDHSCPGSYLCPRDYECSYLVLHILAEAAPERLGFSASFPWDFSRRRIHTANAWRHSLWAAYWLNELVAIIVGWFLSRRSGTAYLASCRCRWRPYGIFSCLLKSYMTDVDLLLDYNFQFLRHHFGNRNRGSHIQKIINSLAPSMVYHFIYAPPLSSRSVLKLFFVVSLPESLYFWVTSWYNCWNTSASWFTICLYVEFMCYWHCSHYD
jgi:hypothetical protein